MGSSDKIRIWVKGEFAFGLPKDYQEVELPDPTFEAIFDHFQVNEKIRPHLLPLINDGVSKLSDQLSDGDRIILQSPYSGG